AVVSAVQPAGQRAAGARHLRRGRGLWPGGQGDDRRVAGVAAGAAAAQPGTERLGAGSRAEAERDGARDPARGESTGVARRKEVEVIRYPKIRFVDAPEASAVVRFDFNADDPGADAATAVLADDFSLGAPTLRGEPGESGRFYDPRQMSLPVQVHGSKALALKVQQRLAREVLRPDNWLMVQLNADTEPVWLRTFQSQPNPLNFDLVFVEGYNDVREDHWRIPLTLDAEPFAVGSEVTLDLGTVLNNPTLPSGGSVIELPEIKGDAPAPLNVLISSASNTMRGLAVASVADGDVIVPWTEPLAFSAAMGSAVADSAFLAGEYHQTTSAVTSSWTAITDPMLITPAARGRYKVLVRVGEDSTSEVASWPARVQVSASA